MAAEIFNDVISYVENSKLNYFINKTPFSATISLKSSLIKRHKTAPEPEIKLKDSDYEENVKQENEMLKKKLEVDKEMNAVIAERKRLESAREKDQEKIKELENQIADIRSELLTVKRDKNKSSQKYKTLEEEFSLLEANRNKVKEENKAIKEELENKIKNKNKLLADKTSECKQLVEDKVQLEEQLDNAHLELKAAKKESDTDNNNELKLKCSLCDSDFVQAVELRKHIRSNHCKDQVSQTRTVNKFVSTQTDEKIETCESEYPCFYCDYVITSFEDLMQHKGDCPVLEMFQDKCDQCDAKFTYRSDLIDHYKTNHPEISLVWCDFCQAGFGALAELQCHIRMVHKNNLP